MFTCDEHRPGNATDGATSMEPKAAPTNVALLDRDQAASYLGGMSVDHFDRHVRPHVRVKLVGRTPFFRPADLDAYASSGAKEL